MAAARRLGANHPAKPCSRPRSVVVLSRLQAAHGEDLIGQLARMMLGPAAARVL